MSIERVRTYLAPLGFADKIMEFDVSSATVELAAKALGREGCRIAKSLAFLLDGKAILVVAAGDARIDNPRYKARFGGKPKMLSPEQTVELVGHAVGGVCPFAVNEGVSIYLDRSLCRFETVFPAMRIGWMSANCPRYDPGKNKGKAPPSDGAFSFSPLS